MEIDPGDGGEAAVARLRCGLPAGYPETSCASVSQGETDRGFRGLT